jgi:putative endonuclease
LTRPASVPGTPSWLVYVLECDNGSYYTGVTNDLKKRFAAHRAGRGARYTRMHPPVRILMTVPAATKNQSLQLEIWLKRKGRTVKEGLFRSGAAGILKAWRKYKKQIDGKPALFPWQGRPPKKKSNNPTTA